MRTTSQDSVAITRVDIQLYTFPYLLTGYETPVMVGGFVRGLFEPSRMAANVALLGVLAALGLAAVALVILSRLRIELRPRDRGAPGGPIRPGWAVATGVAVAAVLAVAGYGLWPWLTRLLRMSDLVDCEACRPGLGAVLAGTWLPPLAGGTLGVAVAALAGFAIGGLRPLGRFSPLLLLAFAPWLFVGDAALFGITSFDRIRLVGTQSWLTDLPIGLVVVPAVVVFAMLFAGQRPCWQQMQADGVAGGAALVRAMVRPAVPLLLLALAATWLVQAQSMVWHIFTPYMGRWSALQVVFMHLRRPDLVAGEPPVALVLPVMLVVVLAAGLAVLQLTYLERLAITTAWDRLRDASEVQPGAGSGDAAGGDHLT